MKKKTRGRTRELVVFTNCIQVEMTVTSSNRQHLQGGPKNKPLPKEQKIVLNRIKAC